MIDDCITPLLGLPLVVEIAGDLVTVGPHKQARELACEYMIDAKLPYKPIKTYVRVDVNRATKIADEYKKMLHDPDDPKVKRSYDAMIAETIAQFQFVKKTGICLELLHDVNPYLFSPRLALLDIINNNHLWVLPTERLKSKKRNILIDYMTNEYIGNVQLCANDVFRVTHDYFGHLKEGVGFLADGEENAWRCHSTMYSRIALGALTTELRGQNSWVNFGTPHGEQNRKSQRLGKARLNDLTVDQAIITYAEQNNGLLPEWVWDEGREDA